MKNLRVLMFVMSVALVLTACGKEKQTIIDRGDFETKYEDKNEDEVNEAEEVAEIEEVAEDLCEELECDDDTTLYNKAIYAGLLKNFMESAYCGNYEQYLSIITYFEVIPFDEGMVFSIFDYNNDGIDELIIPDCKGAPDNTQNVNYNVFLPNEDWEQARSLVFNYYDPETGNYAKDEGGLGGEVEYYSNQNGVYERYDVYEYAYGDYYDESIDDYVEINEYYHIINGESILIDEAEFNNQPAFKWKGLDVKWQEINYENIDALTQPK